MMTEKVKAIYVAEVLVIDPDTKMPVELTVYKDSKSGGMVGVDACFVAQEEPEEMQSPFGNYTLMLVGD